MQSLQLKQRLPKLPNSISLLEYLTSRFTYKSQEQWSEQIASGRIYINGVQILEPTVIHGGEDLEYHPAPFVEPPINSNYQIIYQDEAILVVNKPAPIPMMSIRKYHQHSLLILLEKGFPGLKLFPVHRLDLETSGVVVFAKTSAAASHLGKQFLNKTIQKTYLAWVHGKFPSDLKLLRSHLQRLPDRPHFIEAAEGALAETQVQILESLPQRTLLELKPLTGRTHQLRVQLSSRGFPIVGDKRYIDYPHSLDQFLEKGMTEELFRKLGAARQLLHAWKINFINPSSEKLEEYTAELPEDFDVAPSGSS